MRHRLCHSVTERRPGLSATTSLVILGAGGHALSVADLVPDGMRRDVHFVSPAQVDPTFRVDADAIAWATAHCATVALGMGDLEVRAKILERHASLADSPGLIAPTASVSNGVSPLGGGTIHHHAHVGPDSTLGLGVIINTGAIVEHGASVGHCSHIAPGARVLGDAHIGDQCLVGGGAVVTPGVTVASGCTIGAGAVVIADLEPNTTVAGVPARKLTSRGAT